MKRGDRLGIRDIMMGASCGHLVVTSSFIIVGHSQSLTLPTALMGMYKSLPQVHQNHYFLLWNGTYGAIVLYSALYRDQVSNSLINSIPRLHSFSSISQFISQMLPTITLHPFPRHPFLLCIISCQQCLGLRPGNSHFNPRSLWWFAISRNSCGPHHPHLINLIQSVPCGYPPHGFTLLALG